MYNYLITYDNQIEYHVAPHVGLRHLCHFLKAVKCLNNVGLYLIFIFDTAKTALRFFFCEQGREYGFLLALSF